MEPVRNPVGQLVCPTCLNTGHPQAAAGGPSTWPAQAGSTAFRPANTSYTAGAKAPGATASMVLGILAFFTWVFGIVLAILALVFGYKAKRLIRESGGRLGGAGQAKAGRILGWVYIALIPAIVILAAVVFVLVNNLGNSGDVHFDDSQTLEPGTQWLQAFRVSSDASTVDYTYAATGGTDIRADIVRAISLENPRAEAGTPTWATATGASGQRSVVLDADVYSLRLQCLDTVACVLDFTVDVKQKRAVTAASTGAPSAHAPPEGAVAEVPEPAPCIQPSALPSGRGSNRLPAWQPPPGTMPRGNAFFVHSPPGDFIGQGKNYTFTPTQGDLRVTSDSNQPGGGRARVLVDVGIMDIRRDDWGEAAIELANCDRLHPGYYPVTTRGGADVAALGYQYGNRYCNQVRSAFLVDQVDYDEAGNLLRLVLRFEQSCDGGPYLLAKVDWTPA